MQKLVTMELTPYYEPDNDQHIFAIDKLVHELGIPAEEVNNIYREILEELKNDSTARNLLPGIVSIRVKKRVTGGCRSTSFR